MENAAPVLQTKSFIHNEWVGDETKPSLIVKNKFEQIPIAKIPLASQDDIEKAIQSSLAAFLHFKNTTALERKDLLEKLFSALKLEREKFINLIISEAGKPHDYASAEIDRALTIIDVAIHELMLNRGEVIPMNHPPGIGRTALTKKYPIGPILAISPFNFPLNLALHKIIPALATGNTVILKPSPQTPLTALAFASLCKKVGVPAGVLNVVVCDNAGAEILVRDERIKMLSFTGSADIGWKLKAMAGKKKVVLELGGNAAAIVDRTANITETAKALATGAFLYAGQICISTQRIYVDELIFDQFVVEFKQHTSELKIGNPEEKGVIVGPVIDRGHLERIHHWIQEAKDLGAEILMGGEILDLNHHLYPPTILTNTKRGMKVVDEEVFGPVVIIEKVKYFDEVIREINLSRYGLQASLFTNQLSQIKYAEEHLEVGALIINAIPGFRLDSMPYGGVKDSGLGREGVKYAMEEMCESRLLVY